MPPHPQMNYASWGARVGGSLLNGLSSALFSLPAMVSFYTGPREYRVWVIDGKRELVEWPTAQGWAIIIALNLIGTMVFLFLYCRAVGKTGQFWGHRAASVRIVNAADGSAIGAGKALGRYFAHILDVIPCFLGFLWPLWDQKRQTFADKIVGTVSVRV